MLTELLNNLMTPCYWICRDYYAGIVLFTLITKILLFPISLWCQKNALTMVALMPEMMLETAAFDLEAIPLDPPQHRTIGLATLPIKETTLLVRTFIAFCKSYEFN